MKKLINISLYCDNTRNVGIQLTGARFRTIRRLKLFSFGQFR